MPVIYFLIFDKNIELTESETVLSQNHEGSNSSAARRFVFPIQYFQIRQKLLILQMYPYPYPFESGWLT